jgi:LytR cell envelope-related transcriptional attenuator
LPEIIQDIGAYAGLASVVGLAVLSALYFSQARDVKRLREWAGRAPERAEQGVPAVPGRVVAEPQAEAEVARPSAPPVPAQVAAGGARPAAATPAGGKPAAAATAPPTPAGANSKGATQAPAKPSVPVPGGGNAGSRPPAPPVPRPASPSPQPTAIIPPPRRDPWYRRLAGSPRYVVLAIAGVLIVGGAAAFGVTELLKEDDAGGGGSVQGEPEVSGGGGEGGAPQERERRRRPGAGVNPANVTVAVLNGTTVPGLAATLSDQVEEAGFQEGTIANFLPNQQLAESVVQYTPGHEREAAAVSRRLDIAQREAANPSSQELAGDATVIVLVGADKAP